MKDFILAVFFYLNHRQLYGHYHFVGAIQLVEEHVYVGRGQLNPGWSPIRELLTPADARHQNMLMTEANHQATPGPFRFYYDIIYDNYTFLFFI